jgi:hypothetical protein
MTVNSIQSSAACPDENALSELVQRLLDTKAAAQLEAHLEDCAECRGIVSSVSPVLRDSATTRAHTRAVEGTARHAGMDVVLVPTGLATVIARCLDQDPARRFHSVDELSAALAPFIAWPTSASTMATRAPAPAPVPVPVPAPAPVPVPVPVPAPPQGASSVSRRWLVPVVAAALVIAMIGGTVAWYFSGPSVQPRAAASLLAAEPPADPAVTADPPRSTPATSTAPVVPGPATSSAASAADPAPRLEDDLLEPAF